MKTERERFLGQECVCLGTPNCRIESLNAEKEDTRYQDTAFGYAKIQYHVANMDRSPSFFGQDQIDQ